MSRSRSPYFYSPLKVQSDQKDVIIAHLKQEIYHLKKNQQHFYVLQDQYRALDHKYRLLAEEKIIVDADFKQKHDLALRNICQLKNEIEAFRAELRQKNLEIDDLETDQNTLKNQIDQRLIEIQKLKNDLSSLLADNDEMLNEKLRLEQIANGIRKQNQSLLTNIKNIDIDSQSVRRKIDDLEKYLMELRSEQGLLKDKIISYENQNNRLDQDINTTMEDIAGIQGRISSAQSNANGLQAQLAEMAALNDKYKSQTLHSQRANQAQVMKNNDLLKQLTQAQNVLRIRVSQVEQGHRQLQGLKNQTNSLNEINNRLQDDLEYCRKHLQNLGLLNSDLITHLETFSQDDEFVRNLIDRKNRVIRSKVRVQQATSLISRTIGSGNSPNRKSKVIY